MALRRTLSPRFLRKPNLAAQLPHTPLTLRKNHLPELPNNILSPHRRISHSAASFDCVPSPPYFRLPVGDHLMKTIYSSLSPDRMRLIIPPLPQRSQIEMEEEDVGIESRNRRKISVQDAKKLLRYSRIQKAREKLKSIPKLFISYSDFVQICREIAGGGDDVAAALDNSGAVVVIGDVVLLRPEQLAQAMESVSDPRRSELKEMEAEKAVIDGKAKAQVKRELWAGLGLAVLQTAAFMRLTFWELSWDVMEPVCFFTTSIYFIMGWAYFLRTSKEPSFEGFYSGRFAAKQSTLLKAHKFDLSRFHELSRALTGWQGSDNRFCTCGCHSHHWRAETDFNNSH